MFAYCMFDLSSVFLQYFDTVGWVFWPVKNRLPYNLYCVGRDVAQSNPIQYFYFDNDDLSNMSNFCSNEP